jgi:hypothetical protein
MCSHCCTWRNANFRRSRACRIVNAAAVVCGECALVRGAPHGASVFMYVVDFFPRFLAAAVILIIYSLCFPSFIASGCRSIIDNLGDGGDVCACRIATCIVVISFGNRRVDVGAADAANDRPLTRQYVANDFVSPLTMRACVLCCLSISQVSPRPCLRRHWRWMRRRLRHARR